MRKQYRIGVIAAFMWCVLLNAASGMGTPAGTVIQNQATASFTVGSANYTQQSNTDTIQVAEIINVAVTWQEAANVTVSPGDADQVVTFRIINTGNGSESFSILADSDIHDGSDQFDPVKRSIYIESDGVAGFSAGDAQYVETEGPDPVIDGNSADNWVDVYVLNSIPTDVNDGDIGHTSIQVVSTTTDNSAAPGQVFIGQGTDGVDAVAGSSSGNAAEQATYQVVNVTITITKTSSIESDPVFGTQPVPGATITYLLTIEAVGSGTAVGVVVTDPIPENTTYVPGSLVLNGTSALTDIEGDDIGSVTDTNSDSELDLVTVTLGDLSESDGFGTLSFQVTID